MAKLTSRREARRVRQSQYDCLTHYFQHFTNRSDRMTEPSGKWHAGCVSEAQQGETQ